MQFAMSHFFIEILSTLTRGQSRCAFVICPPIKAWQAYHRIVPPQKGKKRIFIKPGIFFEE